jgi:3-oxoacyl-(acyl-carrier-protein) synthase
MVKFGNHCGYSFKLQKNKCNAVFITISFPQPQGVVCSLGHEVRSVWRKILDGKCGITKISNPGTQKSAMIHIGQKHRHCKQYKLLE